MPSLFQVEEQSWTIESCTFLSIRFSFFSSFFLSWLQAHIHPPPPKNLQQPLRSGAVRPSGKMDHFVTASVSNLCQISAAASSASFVVQLFNTASTHKNKQTNKQKESKTVFQKTKQEKTKKKNNNQQLIFNKMQSSQDCI